MCPPVAAIGTLFLGSSIFQAEIAEISTSTPQHKDCNASCTDSCAIVNGKQET